VNIQKPDNFGIKMVILIQTGHPITGPFDTGTSTASDQ
jgi:hypothetical protein